MNLCSWEEFYFKPLLRFFSLFLDGYLGLTELSDENMITLNQRLKPLIRLLESRYLIIFLDLLFGFHKKLTR